MSSSITLVPMRVKLAKTLNNSLRDFLESAITVKRNGEILDVIDRKTALDLHQKRIIHFDPRRRTAFILSSNRDYVYERENRTCFYCNISLNKEQATLDHLHPRCKGGQGVVHNLVLSCKQCNNLKANRSVRRFLINPYNINGRPGIPTNYFATQKALDDFRSISGNSSYTIKEMIYYFLNETKYKTFNQEMSCYFSSEMIFICQGIHITEVRPNRFFTRLPLLRVCPGKKQISHDLTGIYTPYLKAIQEYQKISQRTLTLDAAVKLMNKNVLFESDQVLSLGDYAFVFSENLFFLLHHHAICTVKFLSPIIRKIIGRNGASHGSKSAGEKMISELTISKKAICQYRSSNRNLPDSVIAAKIRELLQGNFYIYRISSPYIILRTASYLLTLSGKEIKSISRLPLRNSYAPLRKRQPWHKRESYHTST